MAAQDLGTLEQPTATIQASDCAQSGKPIQPYRLDPVVLADNREGADARDRDLGLLDPTTRAYLNEPDTDGERIDYSPNAAATA